MFIQSTFTNQPTMETEARRASLARARKRMDDPGLAVRMTRSLRSVPFECRALYDVRRGRRSLMGMFPTVAITLAQHGAKPADVLYPVEAIEREVMREYGTTVNASLADLQRDETEATHRLDQAQLKLAAHPHDKAVITETLDATYDQKIATELLSAKLTEMEAAL